MSTTTTAPQNGTVTTLVSPKDCKSLLAAQNQLAAGNWTVQEFTQFVQDMTAAEVRKSAQQPLYVKASVSGAVSVYGLQRMPVTLYADQWERLSGYIPTVQKFIAENRKDLSKGRDDKRFEAARAQAKAKWAAANSGDDSAE